MERPAIELSHISKSFGKNVALDDVSIQVAESSIHGLVGENGAGKSTAMKILFGLYQPDTGQILVGGEKRQWRSTRDANAAGIGMVHQHFMLSPTHTVLDNIILGVEPSSSLTGLARLQLIDRQHARTELRVIMKLFELQVDLDTKVGDLPVGIQQRIEILKVLYRRANVLIFDEPTAVLTPQETESFIFNIKKLRTEGKTIIIITHKLKEILACADLITVMRRGKVVGKTTPSATTEDGLAEMMVGRPVRLRVSPSLQEPAGDPVLQLEKLSYTRRNKTKAFDSISLSIRGGEILGVAGVDGNGQGELISVLSNPRASAGRRLKGEIILDGKSAAGLDNRDLRVAGVGFIPADRMRSGLLPHEDLTSNFALGQFFLPAFQKHHLLAWGKMRQSTRQAVERFDVRPKDVWARAGDLSGGNQQKLIFARELQQTPRLLIIANPTRGVDVGSIEFLHEQILAARSRGCAILLISSELSEVMGLSDRMIVLSGGKIAGALERDAFDESTIGLLMGGCEVPPPDVSPSARLPKQPSASVGKGAAAAPQPKVHTETDQVEVDEPGIEVKPLPDATKGPL